MLDMAQELDITIIEDSAYQALRYDGHAIPPILAMDIDREGHIDEGIKRLGILLRESLTPRP